jgi:TonB-linked SusC/RagA family outer membrane protein
MGGTPVNYSTNVTIGGGSDKVKFNLSLTQSEDKGIIMGSGVRRTNINFKANVQITKNLSLQFNPKFTFRRDEGAGGEHVGTGGIIDVLQYRPTNGLREYGYIDPAYADPDEAELFNYTNPKNDISLNQQIKHSYTYTNGIALDWKPIKGLTLRTEATIGLRWNDSSRFYGALTSEGQKTVHNKMPVATISNGKRLRYIWTNTAVYNTSIKDDHNLSFLVGQEISDVQDRTNEMTNHYFPRTFTAKEAWNNMGFGTTYESTSELSAPNRTASFFGQVSYNYKHKYLISATFRADGSTKFAPGHQWGYFPSISGAWVISEEPFMKKFDWISQLKLRVAIGLAGNNNINDDLWRQLFNISNTGGAGFGETTRYGEKYYSVSSSAPNNDIQWESTITRNVAADISLFNGRVTITPEFYWNTTRDLLYSTGLNPTVGYDTQMQNIGQVTNKGIEFAVSGDILQGKDYVLSANINFGWNRKIIDKLDGGIDMKPFEGSVRWQTKNMYDYYLKVGSEVGLIYGFVYDGLYGFDEFYYDPQNNYQAVPWGSAAADNGTSKNQAPREDGYVTVINDVSGTSNSGIATLPGKIKFKDLNGDGRIDENDRTVIGNTNPKIQGGFGLSGQWKDFDFTANFTYMLDFDVNNATAYTLSASEGNKNKFNNVLAEFADGWQYNDIDGHITGTKGDILYKMYYAADKNAVDIYKEGNMGRSLWNPADVGTKLCNSYFIEDGSFLRCNDITLGYTLPKTLTQKIGVSKARFYVSASNLFIITKYTGYDPEVDIQTGLACGIDYYRYPGSRTFTCGTNITF